jgi:aconitase A
MHSAPGCARSLAVDGLVYRYYSLAAAAQDPALAGLAQLPFSMRVLAENLLRHAGAPDVEPGMLAASAASKSRSALRASCSRTCSACQ